MSSLVKVPTVSIRYTLPAIFAVLIMITVSVVGWLAFRSGQQAIDDLATQLSQETAARIEEHTSTYVATPHLFHQINGAAIHTGNLDVADLARLGLERYLWEQVRLTGSVPFIYYGTEQGEIMGVERKEDDTMALWILDKGEDPYLNIYPLDENHNRGDSLDRIEYDPRIRPWYQAAVEVGGPTWSTIYPDISRPILVITAVNPVHDETGTLLGVLGIDLSLGQISDFMRTLEIGQTGQAFIVERSGEIVASSSDEPPSIATDEGQERLNVEDSSEPLISLAGQALQQELGGFDGIDEERQLVLTLDGVRHYVQVAPLQDGRGLDWLIVVVVPETDFMGPIYANVRSNVVLGVVILLVAAIAGFAIARWIIRPILAVTDAAVAVETEQFVPESLAPVARRTDELGMLARLFQRMAQEVHAREQWLKHQLQQLRIEIDDVRRKRQVDGIVETEFFRDLQAKARTMRGQDEEEGAGKEDEEP